MEHKRQRVQFGWVCLKARKKGPDVWVLRYRENLSNGVSTRRSVTIGTVKEFPERVPAHAKPLCLGLFDERRNSKRNICYVRRSHSHGIWRKRFLKDIRPHRGIGAG